MIGVACDTKRFFIFTVSSSKKNRVARWATLFFLELVTGFEPATC